MHTLILSFNHRNCDIVTREKISLKEPDTAHRLSIMLKQKNVAEEIVILSTCNRIEIMTATHHPRVTTEHILRHLSVQSELSHEELEGRVDSFEDEGAVHHLFSVAASLDSLVIGETQIVGQLKDSYHGALDEGFCGAHLSRLIQAAFRCSAEVRSSSEITKNPVSVSSVAVQQAKAVLGDLQDQYAVVVGAGEMSRLAIKHLHAAGVYVILLNRSEDKAHALAREIGGAVMVKPYDSLPEVLNQYPLLFSATSAPDAIIRRAMVRSVAFERLWFDLALPRDIENMEGLGISLFQIDDLRHMVEQNIHLRQEQANAAYKIVGHHTEEYFVWLKNLSVDPVIKAIREQAKQHSLQKLDEAVRKGFIDSKQQENVRKLLHSVFNSFLHTPTINLKSLASEPHADTVIETLSCLFDLQESIPPLSKSKNECEMVG